jgi:amidase
VYETARVLAGLGHDVVEAFPEFSRDALVHAYLVALAAAVAAEVAVAARATGRRPGPGTLEPETAALAAGGRILTAEDLVLARAEMDRAARSLAPFFEEHDLLVTASMGHPPLPIGALAPRRAERLGLRAMARVRSRALLERLFAEIGGRSFEATGNTMLFNQTGQPAMSVPVHWTLDGLPVGVQLAGRFGDEATLFRIASELERARPWADRAPAWIEDGAAPAPSSYSRDQAPSSSRTRS